MDTADDTLDERVDRMARAVVARRLETPAIFFLEAQQPVSFAASQALLLGEPLLGAFFGFGRVREWSALLEDRDGVRRLLDRIEELVHERDTAPEGLNGQ